MLFTYIHCSVFIPIPCFLLSQLAVFIHTLLLLPVPPFFFAARVTHCCFSADSVGTHCNSPDDWKVTDQSPEAEYSSTHIVCVVAAGKVDMYPSGYGLVLLALRVLLSVAVDCWMVRMIHRAHAGNFALVVVQIYLVKINTVYQKDSNMSSVNFSLAYWTRWLFLYSVIYTPLFQSSSHYSLMF